MTTTTMQPQRNGLGLLAGLVLIIAIAVVGFMALDRLDPQPMAQVVRLPNIVVPEEDHAAEKHGSVAYDIRKCLQDKGGADMIYRDKFRDQFYALCRLPNGKWGVRIFYLEQVTKIWTEGSAYIPKDGSLARVQSYLAGFASRFKGPFPWD